MNYPDMTDEYLMEALVLALSDSHLSEDIRELASRFALKCQDAKDWQDALHACEEELKKAQRKAEGLDKLEMFVHEHGHIELMNLGCRFGIVDCLTHEEYADVDGSLLEAIEKVKQ